MRYDITNIAIEDYLHDLMPPRDEVLASLETRAKQQGLSLVGPVQGQFLYLQALMMNARNALEVGITTGYAAIYIMKALRQTGGKMTAIERNPERVKLATEVISAAGMSDLITIHLGEWYELLPSLNEQFDLIFLDVLRSSSNDMQATQALELCVPLLQPGGVLIADNVLCSAQVLEEDVSPLVRGIQRFNRAIMEHPQLESVIIPLRDGVSISRKKLS
ncbi:MAG: O-methyltransferase [Chloroflexus aggregans]|jgi:predicted O-methyltransferase YrrM|uniref:O-methyltransferase n=1 Tax=Chloroflexus aggregans TaxID=152260 RepID=A0A2J6WVI7_9CHLR|nr:O-methyltransferase [Chloroflexus sp.]PMP74928.1 MAG: O-methyltransferase [Chloroflexus aggregans]GIV87866.1 MAG: O-methyltransferase [Chloroflexus sp.]